MKKLTEGEQSKQETDLKMLPSLSEGIVNKDKRVAELAFKQLMVFSDNNPKVLLDQFEKKAQGIISCINCYVKGDSI